MNATHTLPNDITLLSIDSVPALAARLAPKLSRIQTLQIRGNADLLTAERPSVMIDGSRSCTGYGERTALQFAGELAAAHTIYANGSYGIATQVIRATLMAGGAPVVFLAGGFARLFPMGNQALYERVVEQGGALVTAAPVDAVPTRWLFIERNQIAGSLADATLIVEAGRRSGAMGTARAAAAAGRIVGAVPGPITSAQSDGCHELIRTGDAALVATPGQLAELITPTEP